MALIECPECKQKVSDKAAACPNCGMPLTGATQTPTQAAQRIDTPPPLMTSAVHDAATSAPVTGVAGARRRPRFLPRLRDDLKSHPIGPVLLALPALWFAVTIIVAAVAGETAAGKGGVLFLWVTAILVFIEARRLNKDAAAAGREPLLSPIRSALLSLLLWPIGYPAYFRRRALCGTQSFFFAATVIACLVTLVGILGLFVEPEEAMPSKASNWMEYGKAMQSAQTQLTLNDMEQQPDPGKRCELAEKLFVKPMIDTGYNFDKSVRQAARDLNEGKLTVTDAQAVMGMVMIFKQMKPDLERCHFISAETAAELDRTKL
jgi:zinc-ribbon domain